MQRAKGFRVIVKNAESADVLVRNPQFALVSSAVTEVFALRAYCGRDVRAPSVKTTKT